MSSGSGAVVGPQSMVRCMQVQSAAARTPQVEQQHPVQASQGSCPLTASLARRQQ